MKILDVTIGTIRIILLSRGRKLIVPILGFIEVLISLLAIAQIMKNLNNPVTYLAYAFGFSAGNYVGMLIEEKLAIGILVFRIIIVKDASILTDQLKEAGFGVTIVNAKGSYENNVSLIYTIVKRKHAERVVKMIHKCNIKAFYTIEDAKVAIEGTFIKSYSNSTNKYKMGKLFKAFSDITWLEARKNKRKNRAGGI